MITFAIISCNRLYYLKNCIQSIQDFVDLNDVRVLVIDNASSENGLETYLNELPKDFEIKRYTDRHPNELHRAMNFAIEFSRKSKNEWVNFIQEDYQYVYKHSNLNSMIYDVSAKKPKVVQLQTNFGWRRKAHKHSKFVPVMVNGTKWYLMKRESPCDNGFTRVSIYEKIGLYPTSVSIHGKESGFISGEKWIAGHTRGFKRMNLAEPNMGMMFDSAYVRKDKRVGRYFPAPNRLYLKPFDKAKRKNLHNSAMRNEVVYLEDVIEFDGWQPTDMIKHSEDETYESV